MFSLAVPVMVDGVCAKANRVYFYRIAVKGL